MSLLAFDALGRWALAQLPSNGNFALLASRQSIAVAGQVAVFRTSGPAAAGAFTLTGIAAGFRVLEPASAAAFAFAGNAAAFVSLQPGVGASFVLTGSATSAKVSAVASPGAVTLSGASLRFFVSLASGQGAFVSTGRGSTYSRDHEAWVRRPFDTMSWQADATLLPLTWNGAAAPTSLWTIDEALTNAWTPASIEPEPWTIE
jgi:hypothetical protein